MTSRYIEPQIPDSDSGFEFTERIEFAEIRREKDSKFLTILGVGKFDFSRRIFRAVSRHDRKLEGYFYLNDDGSFVRANPIEKGN